MITNDIFIIYIWHFSTYINYSYFLIIFYMRLKLFLDNQKYDIFGYHISNKTSIFSILLFDNNTVVFCVIQYMVR